MRVLCLSDLHLNMLTYHDVKAFIESLPKSEDVDVCALAGDITGVSMMAEHFKMFSDRYKQTLIVLGNHDYWGYTLNAPKQAAEEIAGKLGNVHILQNKSIEINGKKFHGGTLWFPETPESEWGARGWCDFLNLVQGRRQVYRENDMTKNFLNNNVRAGDFVITHHLPSYNCVSEQWKGDSSNCYYVGAADKIIANKMPAFWLHGHTHIYNRIMLGDTDVICNPKGYAWENNNGFNPGLIVEY